MINRSPTSKEGNKTPYECVYREKPDVSDLVLFYAPGIYQLTKEEKKGKGLKYKGSPCRFLGYPPESPANYLIMDIITRRVMVRKSVKFEDNIKRRTIESFEDPKVRKILLEEYFEPNPDEEKITEELEGVEMDDMSEDIGAYDESEPADDVNDLLISEKRRYLSSQQYEDDYVDDNEYDYSPQYWSYPEEVTQNIPPEPPPPNTADELNWEDDHTDMESVSIPRRILMRIP
jgi:hypothetical protein